MVKVMKKIKILQFPISNRKGGITRYALNNWRYMNKEKFECDFATCSQMLDFAQEILDMGAGLKYISCYAEENEEKFKQELKDVISGGYDVVHLHTANWKSFCAEEVARQCGVKRIIVHAHMTDVLADTGVKREELYEQHMKLREKFNSQMATNFCACSRKAADWLFGEQIEKEKILILKNAIDVKKYVFNENIREKYRKILGIQNHFVIGHVGRLSPEKNQNFLLEVFADVIKRGLDARFLLIGEGPCEYDLRKAASILNIEEKVLFLGAREDVNLLLQAMDVFVFSSNYEAMPLALLEAQAAGLKCIIGENIPEEICITSNVLRLSLNHQKWEECLVEFSEKYERHDMSLTLKSAGYDILEQIKIVEKIYEG